ncbi:uncharacterized protein N7518_008503, partial [Penicillium psychrosexuale]|uniref:uncharacterized protein n=1 Tax=Penicillium psychrosexuale TaxID=1002107 RepID=UPI0025454A20
PSIKHSVHAQSIPKGALCPTILFILRSLFDGPHFSPYPDFLRYAIPSKNNALKHDDAKLEGTELIYNGAIQEQILGRKTFFAYQDKIVKEKRYKQLQESSYIFSAYTDKDSIREKDKRIPKTKRIYYHTNFSGSTVIRREGKKSKNGRLVITSVLNCAERLFMGKENIDRKRRND